MLNFKTSAALVTVLVAIGNLQAQVTIDEFIDAQGPFVADPDTEVTDDEATVLFNAPGVLGEVRLLLGFMSADAPPASTTTVEVAGGQWLCDVDFSPGGIGDGSCSVSYNRGCDERFYDFTGVDRFQLDLAAIDGPLFLSVFVSDRNGGGGFGFLDTLTTGLNELPRAMILPANPLGIDWSGISVITFIYSNNPDLPGADVSAEVNEISATGSVELVDGDLSQCVPDDEDVIYEDGFES